MGKRPRAVAVAIAVGSHDSDAAIADLGGSRRCAASAATLSRARACDALFCLPLTLPPTVLGYYLLVLLGRHSPLGRLFEALFGPR